MKSLALRLQRAAAVAASWSARNPGELGSLGMPLALFTMVAAAALFARGQLGPWSAALLIALACSLGRRAEHHLRAQPLYPNLPWLRHVMLALGWLMRPYDPNPWMRIELRALGLRATGLRKLTLAGVAERFLLVYGPPTWLYLGSLFWSLMLLSAASRGSLTPGMEQLLPLAQLFTAVWLLPSLLQALAHAAAGAWSKHGERLLAALPGGDVSPWQQRVQSTMRRVRESFPGLRA